MYFNVLVSYTINEDTEYDLVQYGLGWEDAYRLVKELIEGDFSREEVMVERCQRLTVEQFEGFING